MLGNPVEYLFYSHRGRLIDKWHHYFEVYHRHFARFRRRRPVVVEIGVSHGGSLQMWKKYFGPARASSASTSIRAAGASPRTRSTS